MWTKFTFTGNEIYKFRDILKDYDKNNSTGTNNTIVGKFKNSIEPKYKR